jgi:hypothetical protein
MTSIRFRERRARDPAQSSAAVSEQASAKVNAQDQSGFIH